MLRSLALLACVLLGCSSSRTTKQEGNADEPTPAEAKAKVKDEPRTRCWRDEECRLSCIEPGNCCSEPPFCDQARHREDHEAIQATRNCQGFDYTSCKEHDYTVPDQVATPVCKLGRCAVKMIEREPPPDPISLEGYDRSCAKDEDCVLVHTQPCAKCGCAQDPINADELPRFNEAIGAVTCPEYDPWPNIQCGSCMSPTVVCDAGECTTR